MTLRASPRRAPVPPLRFTSTCRCCSSISLTISAQRAGVRRPWWLWMSMTGYLARGTGCSATTRVDFGLYWRMPRSCACDAPLRMTPTTVSVSPSTRLTRGVSVPVRMCDDKAAATPISRILSAFVAPLPECCHSGDGGLRRDDHSSCPAITGRIQRPTRRLRTGRPRAPPYLVLLRAGFCLPPTLRPARCALTAPFHPYPSNIPDSPGEPTVTRLTWREWAALHHEAAHSSVSWGRSRGGIFSVPLVRQVTLPGRYPAHCPMEFGLSSPGDTTRARMTARVVPADSDRLAWLRLLHY